MTVNFEEQLKENDVVFMFEWFGKPFKSLNDVPSAVMEVVKFKVVEKYEKPHIPEKFNQQINLTSEQ